MNGNANSAVMTADPVAIATVISGAAPSIMRWASAWGPSLCRATASSAVRERSARSWAAIAKPAAKYAAAAASTAGSWPPEDGDRPAPVQQRGEAGRDRQGGRLDPGPAGHHHGPDLACHDHHGHHPEHRVPDEHAGPPQPDRRDQDGAGPGGGDHGQVEPRRGADARPGVPRVVAILHGVLTGRRSIIWPGSAAA